MKHYDGPTFFRQHPEALLKARERRQQRVLPAPASAASPVESATPVRFGNDEVEMDRSTASMYASQQARAIQQTIKPRVHGLHQAASVAASEDDYVSAVAKPYSAAPVAFSEAEKPVASSWGQDDWSHSESTTVIDSVSNLTSVTNAVVEPTSMMKTTAVVHTDSQSTSQSTAAESLLAAASVTSVVSSEPAMALVTHASAVNTSTETTHSKPALGHGLADILNEEQNGQKDLALFNHDHADSDDEVALVIDAMPSGRTYAEEDDKDLLTYHFPDLDLLEPPVQRNEEKLDAWIEQQIDTLNATLSSFNVDGEVVDYTVGPTVTQFQVRLGPGVRVNKITNLQDDLKMVLAAKDIRIEAPIPGKSTVGIEIPDLKSRPVMLSEVLRSDAFQNSLSPLTVALGVDLFGQPQVTDLRKMPHGLIAGATGSGKSVFINSLLMSILYKATPQEVKLILIDPKAVEMAPYNGIPHLLAPVVSEPQAAAAALKWAVNEMEERYQRLAAAGARNIEQYNDKAEASGHLEQKMPYILIIIDELADLMMVAASEVQDYIARITQKARAAGLHLLVATQRPSVDVVTGTIKNNIPTRVAFMVASQVDSRTILDTAGAERLLGRGDMLYLGNGKSQPIRLQGTFVDDEIDAVTSFVREQMAPHYAFEPKQLLATEIAAEDQDDLWPEVLTYIADEKTVSTSKLQRVFSIGYNRAANLVDQLEGNGYVSAQQGSKPREVFLTPEKLATISED